MLISKNSTGTLAEYIKNREEVFCSGLFLSARWLVVSQFDYEGMQLIVLPDKDSAEYCAADLYNLISGDTVFFLPDSGKSVERSNYKSTLGVQRTSAVGKITSPVLTTGCGTLKFTYGLAFTDKNGFDFNVDIIQNGEVVKTFNVKKDAAKYDKFTFEEEVNVAGEFQIVFSNNCPSATDGNKDRYSIWDVMWTAHN